MNKVTLRDVAMAAGSSVAAVSLVLNGKAGKARISPTTQDRIRAAARQLGYQPNQTARNIVLRKPYAGIRKPAAAGTPGTGQQGRQIGVALSPKTSRDTLGLLPDLIQELGSAGYRLVIAETDPDAPDMARQQAMQLLQECAGGILCCPTTYALVSALAAETAADSREGARKVIVLWQGAGKAIIREDRKPITSDFVPGPTLSVRPLPVPPPVVKPPAIALKPVAAPVTVVPVRTETTATTARSEATATPPAVAAEPPAITLLPAEVEPPVAVATTEPQAAQTPTPEPVPVATPEPVAAQEEPPPSAQAVETEPPAVTPTTETPQGQARMALS